MSVVKGRAYHTKHSNTIFSGYSSEIFQLHNRFTYIKERPFDCFVGTDDFGTR